MQDFFHQQIINTHERISKSHMKTHQRENTAESDLSVMFIIIVYNINCIKLLDIAWYCYMLWNYPLFLRQKNLAMKENGTERKRDSSGFVAKSREPISREICGNPEMYAKYIPTTWFVRYLWASTLQIVRPFSDKNPMVTWVPGIYLFSIYMFGNCLTRSDMHLQFS